MAPRCFRHVFRFVLSYLVIFVILSQYLVTYLAHGTRYQVPGHLGNLQADLFWGSGGADGERNKYELQSLKVWKFESLKVKKVWKLVNLKVLEFESFNMCSMSGTIRLLISNDQS